MAAETALPGDDFCLEDDPADSAGDRMAARLHPGIEVRPPLSRIPSKSYAHVKRAFDIVFSALGLVALSPVLAACAVAVKATSQGPVLFKQKRWGRAGSRFECWKFRTMLVETPPDMPAQDFADKAAFMTASKLGKTVQVSESTVVRFATQLGYEGYPSMQRALQEMIRGKLTSIQRIQASDGELAGSDLMTNVLQRDMEKIRMAIDQTDGAEFERVVDTIIGARRIYIVGFRSSSFLAGYLNFYFRLIFDNVTLVNGGAAGSFDQLFRVSKDDVVIGICFPRYSELALKTIQFSRDRGATIVGVTDSEMSPINQMSSNSLLVRSEMISFVDSLAAPMSMLNALILAVANKKGADISATFSELEHIWERFDIFGKIEDE